MSCGSTVHMHMNMLLAVWQRPFTLPGYEQIGIFICQAVGELLTATDRGHAFLPDSMTRNVFEACFGRE